VQEFSATLIKIDADRASLLEKRRIDVGDIRKVIAYAQATGNAFVNKVTGHYLAYYRPSITTYWVEYNLEGNEYEIFCAYSHRMEILEGFNIPPKSTERSDDWWCVKCNVPLEQATVKLTYLDETFGANLPSCPSCQRVFVSEENALQKMALAEKMLEDK
jgi:hypothetical protein